MAWAEKHGKRYRGMYRDANKRKRTAGWSHSKREALKMAQTEELKIRQGLWRDPQAGRMSFSEYFEVHWLPNRLREKNTLASYQAHYNSTLKATFGDVEVRRISPAMIQKWVGDRVAECVKPSTIRAQHTTLKTVLGGQRGSSAVRDGLITDNPCLNIDLPYAAPREPDIYSVPELDLLMVEIPGWWQLLPLLAADSGMRWGELMGLVVSDFAPGFKGVWVRRSLQELSKSATGNGTRFLLKDYTKERANKYVTLTDEVAAIITASVTVLGLSSDDRIFSMHDKSNTTVKRTDVWPHGLPVGRSYFREAVWKPAHHRAGVRPRHFHDLRGSHMVWLLAGGVDVLTVMKRVGHRQLKTTQGYLAALPDADQRAVEALERVRARYREKHSDEPRADS